MSSEIIASHAHLVNPSASSLFTRGALVGRGAYGGVYKATHNSTGLVIALKVVDLDGSDDISEVQREVALLSEMRDAARHNITMYHGCYLNGHELWIAMDFASGGSIRTLMKSGSIEEKYIVLIMREVLVALSFLHRQGIIHRDVKAANILLTQAGKILLCDFGVAAHLQSNNKRSTFIGTPLWMAPEVITDGKMYDTKADIWSLGVTLYEVATGNPPHFQLEPLRACALIPRTAPAKLEGGIWTPFMREFLALCLQTEPANRLSADELSKSRWIKSASKLPIVLLRELIVRYLSWVQAGGQRHSLAGIEGLAREDTFELEEEIWDFSTNVEEPPVEPLGDEPPRSLDDQAAISSIRPPKKISASNISRHHPLLRLFDAESNPYAANAGIMYNLPSGLSSIDTVRPMISIPSFEEMEEMAEASTSKFVELPNDPISPSTVRANPFSWTSQPSRSPFVPPSPRVQLEDLEDSPWGPSTSMTATPTDASFPDLNPYPLVATSPSLPSLPLMDRPIPIARRRADTAPSSDYPPLGPGIGAYSPLTSQPNYSHSHYSNHSNHTSSSSILGMSTNSSNSSHYGQNTPTPSPPMAQRPLPSRSHTMVEGQSDANRPFRERKVSDAVRPVLRMATSELGRPRGGSDSRLVPLQLKQGSKLQISTSPATPPASGMASSSSFGGYDSSPASTPLATTANGRYASAFNLATPVASAVGSSFPFPVEASPPTPPPEWPSGPPIRPLDYAKLVTAADVHIELEQTIGELGEWLKVVEVGLGMILQETA